MPVRRLRWLLPAAVVIGFAPVHAPALLMFPYKAQGAGFTVRSETPLPPEQLQPILAEAARRLATSPLARDRPGWNIYLTEGGWRWRWLALNSAKWFAVTRSLTSNTIFNRSDLAAGVVHAPRAIGNTRSLASDIAHEATHGLLYRHFGLWRTFTAPTWAVEGYCDHVAGESTLDAASVARLEASGVHHSAIDNYYARLRVERTLAANGNSVDKLFNEAER
jgi:hypothetical protein